MITKEEVEHIAKLARLGLTENEIEKMRKELSSVLDYINRLQKVNVLNIEPTSHSVLVENVTREDEPDKKSKERADRIIKEAPELKGRHIKVKKIF